MSARLDRIIDVLNEAGFEARATDQIMAELWNKFASIVGLSGATSFFRSLIRPILADAETASVTIGILNARDALQALLTEVEHEALLRDYVMCVGYH